MSKIHNSKYKSSYSESLILHFFLLLLVLFLFLPASPAFSSVEDEVLKIQKAYENIKDVSGSFVQKSYIRDLKETQTYAGEFFIKRPLKMKWSYGGKQPQEVLINNDEIVIYQREEKQAYRSRFDRETYGQAPIALLSGFGNIREEFFVSGKNGKVVLKPKKPMGGIVSIEIEPSEAGFPIKSFTINDSHLNRIDMTLKDVKVNTGLKDSIFSLSLPKSVTIFNN